MKEPIAILIPGIRFMERLMLRHKAGVLSALFLVPVAIIAFGLYAYAGGAIDSSQKERAGVAYTRNLQKVLHAVVALQMDVASADLVTAGQTALQTLEGLANEDGDALSVAADVRHLQSEWTEAVAGNASQRMILLAALLKVQTKIADNSSLTLDPELGAYYLMEMGVEQLPNLVADAARVTNASVGSDAVETAERLGRVQARAESLDTGAERVAETVSDSRVAAALQTLHDALQKWRADIHGDGLAAALLNESRHLSTVLTEELEVRLAQRIKKERVQLWLMASVSLLLFTSTFSPFASLNGESS